ncbi:MAG: DUF998 domain-containing protein [Candidatus Nanohaloarchaea archaeon]|nr:DUF998 domain-containing protein [Candidatus Nanohaloarchaea archaeon]
MQALNHLQDRLDQDAIGGVAGLAAIVIAFLAISSSTFLSKTFHWSGSALSDLGAPWSSVSLIFNTGMILAGLSGLVFGIYLIRNAETRLEWIGAGLFNISMFGLGMVGVFPIGTPWHREASILFFTAFTYAFLVWGTATIQEGFIYTGLASTWLGLLHATVWGIWLASLRPWLGIAVPELAGSLLLALWTTGQCLILLDRKDYLPLPDQ